MRRGNRTPERKEEEISTPARVQALALVNQELSRQNTKWSRTDGTWSSDIKFKLAVLAEEFGEVARAVNELDMSNLEEELIQVAAVALSWYMSKDVGTKKPAAISLETVLAADTIDDLEIEWASPEAVAEARRDFDDLVAQVKSAAKVKISTAIPSYVTATASGVLPVSAAEFAEIPCSCGHAVTEHGKSWDAKLNFVVVCTVPNCPCINPTGGRK